MKTFDDMPAANGANDAPVTRAEFDALQAKVNDLAAKVDADESDDSEDQGDGEDSSIMGAMHAKPAPPAVKQMVKKPGFMGMMKGKPPLK